MQAPFIFLSGSTRSLNAGRKVHLGGAGFSGGRNHTVATAIVAVEDASVTSSSSSGRVEPPLEQRLRRSLLTVRSTNNATFHDGPTGGCNGGIERAVSVDSGGGGGGGSGSGANVSRTASGGIGGGPCPRSHSIRTISNAKIKTVKLTVAVVAGYLICSAPFVFVQLYTVWAEPGESRQNALERTTFPCEPTEALITKRAP